MYDARTQDCSNKKGKFIVIQFQEVCLTLNVSKSFMFSTSHI